MVWCMTKMRCGRGTREMRGLVGKSERRTAREVRPGRREENTIIGRMRGEVVVEIVEEGTDMMIETEIVIGMEEEIVIEEVIAIGGVEHIMKLDFTCPKSSSTCLCRQEKQKWSYKIMVANT